MTGLWQVSGRKDLTSMTWSLDRYYLDKWSLRLGVSIAQDYSGNIQPEGAY
jgi:lipopolysaccharide/colanic/teichoic acid biosynthesis glycosyltransferase